MVYGWRHEFWLEGCKGTRRLGIDNCDEKQSLNGVHLHAVVKINWSVECCFRVLQLDLFSLLVFFWLQYLPYVAIRRQGWEEGGWKEVWFLYRIAPIFNWILHPIEQINGNCKKGWKQSSVNNMIRRPMKFMGWKFQKMFSVYCWRWRKPRWSRKGIQSLVIALGRKLVKVNHQNGYCRKMQ